MTAVLTKHHGLGNDFLVLLDFDDRHGSDTEVMARTLCDRRLGIGADGLMRVTTGKHGADVTMELRNADGSVAEMSGNGIRCLAQAVVDAGVHGGPDLVVATGGGHRSVTVYPETRRGERSVAVDMGEITVDRIDAERAEVRIGNPHLVILDQHRRLDLVAEGLRHPDRNVELIAVHEGVLDLRVHERGVGVTQACGTGSCAAAFVAHRWGLVLDRVTVRNPGGDVVVRLDGDHATLVGPATFIARIEVPWP